jgi:hypothetical protein
MEQHYMKKIIAAFDGLKYSTDTRDYAIYLAKLNKSHLVGVFLDDPTYTSYKIYELISQSGTSMELLRENEAKDKLSRDAAALDFTNTCKANGIEFHLHHDRSTALATLIQESLFADLLILDARETLTHYSETPPTHFIREVLENVQCPVLLIPGEFKPIQKTVVLYDGKPSSVYAIKMFSYLLPALKEIESELVSVNAINSGLHISNNRLMKELMKRHYPETKYTVLNGIPEEEIIKHLKTGNLNTLVVLGAYQRGAVSRWFKESMADSLSKTQQYPLFIAHQR